MKTHVATFIPLLLGVLAISESTASPLPGPGPVEAGLRLRLVVTPHADGQAEGYDVEAALVSASRKPIVLRANQWRSWHQQGGFKDFLEGALSIESYPAIQPWLGQVSAPDDRSPEEPEYTLKPGETLSLKWSTKGRELKNRVGNPLDVQNPEFTQAGLHAVHASLVVTVDGRTVRLRSNEQLVPIGGSYEAPKHTYGELWHADEKTMTARLGLGSLAQIAPGDRFLIQTGLIGRTWTLTITEVQEKWSAGTLEPSGENPRPEFPSRGFEAALIIEK